MRRSQRGAGGGRHSAPFECACATGGMRQIARDRRHATALSGPMHSGVHTPRVHTQRSCSERSLQQDPCSRGHTNPSPTPPGQRARTNARRPRLRRSAAAQTGRATSDDEGQDDREEDEDHEDRTAKGLDTTATDAMAASATDTTAEGTTAADSPGEAETTTVRGGSGSSRRLSLPSEAQRAVSGCQAGEARRAAGFAADIAPADGAGAWIYLQVPWLGRDGDVRRARPSLRRRALTSQMMSTTPCL